MDLFLYKTVYYIVYLNKKSLFSIVHQVQQVISA